MEVGSMMIAKSDFPLIKREVFIFLFLLCLGIVAVIASRVFAAQARLEFLDARHKMNEARSRLNNVNSNLQDRKSYTAEYDELRRRNIIGSNQRPDWTRGLEKMRTQNLVIDFRYAISPQQTYNPVPPPDIGNFDLHLSRMSIRIDLLHEEQLLAFLEALRTGINGWFILDHCSIERTHVEPTSVPDSFLPESMGNAPIQRRRSNLQAECTGGWLTMKNRNVP
jgi:hypothetical protein